MSTPADDINDGGSALSADTVGLATGTDLGIDPAEETTSSGSGSAPMIPRSRPSRGAAIIRLVIFIALAAAVVWAYRGIGFDFSNLRDGLPVARTYLAELFPHNALDRAHEIAIFKEEWGALIQTLQMALFGTMIGAVIAFPVSFFAARTTSLFRPLSVAIKTVLNIGRAIPTIIYAILLVAAFGLGPPSGAIAVAFASTVMLTKLYAEALEGVALGPVEAVRATGGNALQTYVFGMLPQVFPNYLSATLYAFELNIMASAILGIVGAGGLGYDLQNAVRLFKLLDAGAILLLLIVLVNAVDYLSFRVRQLFT